MIQVGTNLNVIDNSGAKKAYCIKIYGGFQRRYAVTGNIILISIKSLRKKRRFASKTKKGEIHKALIVRTKAIQKLHSNDSFFFLENSIVLINKKNKLIGTRIFGSMPKTLRSTKFLRLAMVSAGMVI
jgi:large subunit ribosomal protein L14